MNEWKNEWMSKWLTDFEWMNEWMNEKVIDWLIDWMNNWMGVSKTRGRLDRGRGRGRGRGRFSITIDLDQYDTVKPRGKYHTGLASFWCSHGSGGSQRGEVPHLPVIKKYFSVFTCNPGEAGEVQNAIIWSQSTHINKELIVCCDEAASRFNVSVTGKL